MRFLTKRTTIMTALALIIGVVGWLGYSKWVQARPPITARVPRDLPTILAQAVQPEHGYTIKDCAVDENVKSDEPPDDKGPGKVNALDLRKAYARAEGLFAQTSGRVFKATITPHWFANNTRFWYRNTLKGGAKEFIAVDADKGTRGPAFDHVKLATSLSKAAAAMFDAQRLPFDTVTFTDGAKAIRFEAKGSSWQCDLTTYECTPTPKTQEEETSIAPPEESADDNSISQGDYDPADDDRSPEQPQQKKKGAAKKFQPAATKEARSPDGAWTAFAKDSNVFLRDKDAKEIAVTTTGVAGNAFSAFAWAPDSNAVVAYRTEPGDNKEVYMIETSPRDQLPAKLHTRPYPRPGDKFALHEMWLVDVETKKPTKVEVERIDFRGIPQLRWNKAGSHFTFEKHDRGHQRFRIIEVNARTGATRNIIDEKAETFVDKYSFNYLQYLDATGEILHTSEIDGWKHLYLVDAKTGKIKQQITQGEYVVRGIDRVDVQKRQIWFHASGRNADQDPYFQHYYRVNFDGTGLVALTEGNGDHFQKGGPQYSPDRKFLIDTYSRVDMPPVHTLRRVADGSLVCELDKADITALEAIGWKAPEVFVAKGRDGKTDIWGIVCRPQNYDANKKYPVIEYIYAGPHGSFTPKSFSAYRQMAALAELGFIVVQCDGMGTAHRSRAFHDVCWKNVADAGFPDRILWMQSLAKKYAYIDLTRVGIYGTSAGGQSSTGALLFHPEFYKVAVSSCGCHDNRLDKSSWNEQWMGAMGAHYEKQSNVTNAHKLQGKLLLIVGELDTNVPFESTMRVVDSLIRAKKDFDLLVVPGMGHSDGGTYGNRRRWDYFVRHLHGVEPPDRNVARGE